MIRVKDDHVIRIIHDTLASAIEPAYDVDIGAFGASGVIPGLSQKYNVQHLGLLVFDGEHLPQIRRGRGGGIGLHTFSGLLRPALYSY